jgi:hypothetical protein
MGSLSLNAQRQGQPLTEPVWMDGKQVGVTPWSGEVAVCAVVQVGGDRLPVNTVLREGELVTYTQEVPLTGEAAQGFQLGVRAGGGMANFNGGGFNLGVTARIPIGNWRFVPEVLFKYTNKLRTHKYKDDIHLNTTDYIHLNTSELDVPLLFRTSGIFYLMFGPQISFYFDPQLSVPEYKEDASIEDSNVFDFGPVFGFGWAWAHFDIQFRTSLNLRGVGVVDYYNEYYDDKVSFPSEMDLYLMLSVAGYF